MINSRLSLIIIVLFIGSISANSQTTYKTFERGDIGFDHPSDWNVTDRSTDQVQQFNLTAKDIPALIIVSAYKKDNVNENHFSFLKSEISKPRVGKIAADFENFIESGECVQFKSRNIPGQTIKGTLRNQKTTNSSFSFIYNGKFVHLLYLREDTLRGSTDQVWQKLLSTLQVKGKDSRKELLLLDNESDEHLNGRALKLIRPKYPYGQKGPTTVSVRVTVDTIGDVVAAKAISGNFAFWQEAERAAKQAKFAPSYVCGELSTITGLISYRFN